MIEDTRDPGFEELSDDAIDALEWKEREEEAELQRVYDDPSRRPRDGWKSRAEHAEKLCDDQRAKQTATVAKAKGGAR